MFKGLAWSISLGSFRGGPTFPALFLGVVAGLMASHLPGYAETQAVAALIGAACVAVLRLPLASVMIATLLSAKAGLAVAPLIVVAVAVAYLTSEALTAFVDARRRRRPRPRTHCPALTRAPCARRIRRRVARHNPIDERRNGMTVATHQNGVPRRSSQSYPSDNADECAAT